MGFVYGTIFVLKKQNKLGSCSIWIEFEVLKWESLISVPVKMLLHWHVKCGDSHRSVHILVT